MKRVLLLLLTVVVSWSSALAAARSSSTARSQLRMALAPGSTVLVTGASGLVGTEVCKVLAQRNIKVRRLTTGKPRQAGEYQWDPVAGLIEDGALAGGVAAVVHLAGENIASGSLEGPLQLAGRWSEGKKAKILNSRVQGTRLLVQVVLTHHPSPGPRRPSSDPDFLLSPLSTCRACKGCR
jgi:hypothetical protein